MKKIILPKLGSHLTERQRKSKPHEIHAHPFPYAKTTEEILAIAAEIEHQGYRVSAKHQRPLRLRAPKPGEKAVVVGLTTDQPDDEDPAVFFFSRYRRTRYAVMVHRRRQPILRHIGKTDGVSTPIPRATTIQRATRKRYYARAQ